MEAWQNCQRRGSPSRQAFGNMFWEPRERGFLGTGLENGPLENGGLLETGPSGSEMGCCKQVKSRRPGCSPRKLLRVNGGGDKLGYPQATFVPPLIFLQQP